MVYFHQISTHYIPVIDLLPHYKSIFLFGSVPNISFCSLHFLVMAYITVVLTEDRPVNSTGFVLILDSLKLLFHIGCTGRILHECLVRGHLQHTLLDSLNSCLRPCCHVLLYRILGTDAQ